MRRYIVLGLVFAAVLAFAMRDAIEQAVIQPLLYTWWVIGIYYHSLPQVALWIILVVMVIMMAWGTLASELPPAGGRRVLRKPFQGPVESLAGWVQRAPHGLYFKWMLAQRLGKLSRDLIAFNARQAPRSGREAFSGPGWDPPSNVAAYLESGLNGSFADYPRPPWPFQRPNPTPLDLDPTLALDYIESQIEKS
jgi:hypothetical protein